MAWRCALSRRVVVYPDRRIGKSAERSCNRHMLVTQGASIDAERLVEELAGTLRLALAVKLKCPNSTKMSAVSTEGDEPSAWCATSSACCRSASARHVSAVVQRPGEIRKRRGHSMIVERTLSSPYRDRLLEQRIARSGNP